VAQEPNVAPIEAVSVAQEPNVAPVEAAPVAQEPNAVPALDVVQEANTPIVVPEAAPEATPADQNVPMIPNAPEAPYSVVPGATDANSFDPNVAVAPVAVENGVLVGHEELAVEPNGTTPVTPAPEASQDSVNQAQASDLVQPADAPANADELEARREAAFWATFAD
jgi:hypothetical protein